MVTETTLPFWTPVLSLSQTQDEPSFTNKLSWFVENYFYWGAEAASPNPLNEREVQVIPMPQQHSNTCTKVLFSVLTTLSYLTVIVPIIMAIAKCILRCGKEYAIACDTRQNMSLETQPSVEQAFSEVNDCPWAQAPEHTSIPLETPLKNFHIAEGKIFRWNKHLPVDRLSIFDINTQQLEGAISTNMIEDCRFIGSSVYLRQMAPNGEQNCVRVWNTQNEDQTLTFFEPEELASTANDTFNTDKYTRYGLQVLGNKILVVDAFCKSRDGVFIYEWDVTNEACLTTGQCSRVLQVDRSIHARLGINDCKLTEDGILVLSDKTLHILSTDTARIRHSIDFPTRLSTCQIIDAHTAIVFEAGQENTSEKAWIINIREGTAISAYTPESIASFEAQFPMQGNTVKQCFYSDSLVFTGYGRNRQPESPNTGLSGIYIRSLGHPRLINHISLPPNCTSFQVDSQRSTLYAITSTNEFHEYQFPPMTASARSPEGTQGVPQPENIQANPIEAQEPASLEATQRPAVLPLSSNDAADAKEFVDRWMVSNDTSSDEMQRELRMLSNEQRWAILQQCKTHSLEEYAANLQLTKIVHNTLASLLKSPAFSSLCFEEAERNENFDLFIEDQFRQALSKISRMEIYLKPEEPFALLCNLMHLVNDSNAATLFILAEFLQNCPRNLI